MTHVSETSDDERMIGEPMTNDDENCEINDVYGNDLQQTAYESNVRNAPFDLCRLICVARTDAWCKAMPSCVYFVNMLSFQEQPSCGKQFFRTCSS
jgi:hypothetical protein